MRTLIVCDSEFGNTETLAWAVADVLGQDGPVCVGRPADVAPADLAAIDCLLLAGPTQRHGVSPRLAAFLADVPPGALRGLPAAAFDTRSRLDPDLAGSASRRLTQALREAGAQLIVPAASFTVAAVSGPLMPGEIARARDWAELIRRRLHTTGRVEAARRARAAAEPA